MRVIVTVSEEKGRGEGQSDLLASVIFLYFFHLKWSVFQGALFWGNLC